MASVLISFNLEETKFNNIYNIFNFLNKDQDGHLSFEEFYNGIKEEEK